MHVISFSRKASQRRKHIWTLAGAVHWTNSFIQLVTILSSLNKNWAMHEAAVTLSLAHICYRYIKEWCHECQNTCQLWKNQYLVPTSAWWTIFTPLPSVELDQRPQENMVKSCYHKKKGFPRLIFFLSWLNLQPKTNWMDSCPQTLLKKKIISQLLLLIYTAT